MPCRVPQHSHTAGHSAHDPLYARLSRHARVVLRMPHQKCNRGTQGAVKLHSQKRKNSITNYKAHLRNNNKKSTRRHLAIRLRRRERVCCAMEDAHLLHTRCQHLEPMSYQLLRGVRDGRDGRLGCLHLRRGQAHPRTLAPRIGIGRNVGGWIWSRRRRHRRCRPRVSR